MLSHPKREIPGMQTGWMTERVSMTDWFEGIGELIPFPSSNLSASRERVSMTDWFEGIGELMAGSTWAETSLMLIHIEIPGIYVLPSRDLVFPFDSLDVEILNMSEALLEILVKNPGEETCNVKIFVDDAQREELPLGENFLWEAQEIMIGPREEKQITLKF